MSFLLDANVLLYALNTDVPQHSVCRAWLQQMLASGQMVYTTALNEVALVRLATGPMRLQRHDAFQFLRDLHGLGNYSRLELEQGSLQLWQQLTEDLGLSGNDVNDAYLAALALTHDLTLVTADRGFARFPGLRVLTPA